MAAKFLNVGDTYNGFRDVVTGEYTDSEFAIAWKQADVLAACANGGEFVGDFEDPRLVQSDFGSQERVYLDEKVSFSDPNPPVVRDVLHGYSFVPAPDKVVRCWYCNEDFYFTQFVTLAPQAKDQEANERAFCMEMLLHYSEHRDAGDLPYVTTYFPGKEIVTPSGKVYTKPGVVRTWRVGGKLVGPSANWYDPTLTHSEAIASDFAMTD